MRLREMLAADEAVFLKIFGEPVTYQGREVTGIFEPGEDHVKGNTFASAGQSALATLWVRNQDVPRPSARDTVVVAGHEWSVARTVENNGVFRRLELTSEESVW